MIDNDDVSSALDDFELPDFVTESEVWRTRAHELWLTARADRDLKSMASALQAAFRGLKDWQDRIEEDNRVKEATAQLRNGEHVATVESFDAIVRKVRNYRDKNCTVCPTCFGLGDRERIRQFKDWLQAQGQESVNSFKKWSEPTPKHLIELLPGAKNNDENTDNTITSN